MRVISYAKKVNKKLERYTNDELVEIIMSDPEYEISHLDKVYSSVVINPFERWSLYVEMNVIGALSTSKRCDITTRKEFNKINKLLIEMNLRLNKDESNVDVIREFFPKFNSIFEDYNKYIINHNSTKASYKEFKEFIKFVSSTNNDIKERRVVDFLKNNKTSHLEEDIIRYIVEKTLCSVNSKLKIDVDKFRDKNKDNLKARSISLMIDYLNKIEEEFFLINGFCFNRCLCSKNDVF